MAAKTVLITGANKSIGFETARQLAGRGYRVWLGSRDSGRGEAAAAKLIAECLDARVLAIDVASDSSVQAALQAASSSDRRASPGKILAPRQCGVLSTA